MFLRKKETEILEPFRFYYSVLISSGARLRDRRSLSGKNGKTVNIAELADQ